MDCRLKYKMQDVKLLQDQYTSLTEIYKNILECVNKTKEKLQKNLCDIKNLIQYIQMAL